MSLDNDFRYTTNLFIRMFKFIFKIFGKIFTFLIGLLSFGAIKHKINKNNKKNRGLIVEKPQDIKQLCENGINKNMLISGGNSNLRAYILSQTLNDSFTSCNNGMIVLHIGDNELINALNLSKNLNILRVDSLTKNFDPFYHRTDDEIIHIISDSLPNNMTLNNNAMSLLQGILLYIRATGGTPSLMALEKCPYYQLVDKVNKAIDTGKISEQIGEQIIRYLIAGTSEIQIVANYINSLFKECSSILCIGNYSLCTDVKKAIDDRQILVMDISTAANNILLNIIFSQIRDILRYSPNTKIVLNNLNISSSESKVKDLIQICNNNLIFSTQDLYTTLSGDSSLFDILVSRSSYNIVMQHNNATSSDKWSEKMGAYDKMETDFGFGDIFHPGMIFGKNMHVANKQERVVKPEEIQRLNSNEMYIMDDVTNSLRLTSIM
ncbi:MAG: hypothetical protein NC177_12795 [Ruminococcus flavefaciens]|nr:hypothetical protein [Ruminococcus flavefaciens]